MRREGYLAYRPVLLAISAALLMSALAVVWPVTDQFASRLFYDGNGTFPARGMPALRGLRSVGYATTYIVIAGLIVVLVAKLMGRQLVKAVSWRVWWFLTLGMALAPGLLVNGLLKPIINRPRPVQTDIFGGAQVFVPAWWRGSSEFVNRSFVSGEAAAAMYLIAFAFVVPDRWRKRVGMLAMLWAVVISLNRIAFGAHYLSDVLVAWGLTLVVVLTLRALLLPLDHECIDSKECRSRNEELIAVGKLPMK